MRKIICLISSSKFKKECEETYQDLSLQGYIVLNLAIFSHHDNITITPEQKKILKDLHKQKIELADIILVINKDNYLGRGCIEEIKYSLNLGKRLFFKY